MPTTRGTAPALQDLCRPGRSDDAVGASTAILEFPGYAEARWDLAGLYLQMGARELAKEQLVQVIQMDPGGRYGAMAVERFKELE